ncbi:hypothetical protein D9M70_106440 [compost metagenome]
MAKELRSARKSMNGRPVSRPARTISVSNSSSRVPAWEPVISLTMGPRCLKLPTALLSTLNMALKPGLVGFSMASGRPMRRAASAVSDICSQAWASFLEKWAISAAVRRASRHMPKEASPSEHSW